MITLQLLREQGRASVRTAVLAFGARHTLGDTEPDWERAEQHFAQMVAVIVGAGPPAGGGRA
ncbi:hypothetical protein ABTX34_33445 [Streptomyces sp. NPDC096538]|uniref:hypothetical protein n=1 Tax=Streptomyces sp. NPDC096538 TaxID=3155427 RepID=UPI00332294F8